MTTDSITIFGADFSIFGIDMLTLVFQCFVINQIFDFSTGILASRKVKSFSSKVGINGAIKKFIILLMGIVIVVSVGRIQEIGTIESPIVGYIPLGYFLIFGFFDFSSNLENLAVIYGGNSKEGRLFKLLSSLTELIFNLSLDKLKEVSEKKINDKINPK